MANPVQFASSRPTPNGRPAESLKTGNFYIGSNISEYGTTNRTAFFAGITPPLGGYTTFQGKLANGPSMNTFNSDASLIKFINKRLGQTFTTIEEALTYVVTQDTWAILSMDIAKFVGNEVQFYYDTSCVASYPRTGTTLYDLGRLQNNGAGAGTFNTDASGSLEFNGTSNKIDTSISNNNYFNGTEGSYTISLWIWDNDSPNKSRMFDKSSVDTGNTHNGISIINTDLTSTSAQLGVIIDGVQFDFPGASWNHRTWTKLDIVVDADSATNQITGYSNAGTGRTVNITGTALSAITSTRSLNFGATPRSTFFFKGRMGLISMTQEVLSASQVQRSFDSQKARFGL